MIGSNPDLPVISNAKARWLNVSELESLLDFENTPLPITKSPPTSPPPSGTLILYDRSATRNYKDDGYQWKKKRNSHKVREDHVKLRVGGRYRVAGCYVHCITNVSMHRRAYHLLNPETGTALNPPTSSSMQRMDQESLRSRTPSLVLMHYLDTELASINATKLKAITPEVSSQNRNCGSKTSSPARVGKHRSKSPKGRLSVSPVPSFDRNHLASVQHYYHKQVENSPLLMTHQSAGSLVSCQSSRSQEQHLQQKHSHTTQMRSRGNSIILDIDEPFAHDKTDSVEFDDDTLDILWGMVNEDKNDFEEILENSNLTEILAPSDLEGVLESTGAMAIDNNHIENLQTKEGFAAAAASAVSAFGVELRAAKMQVNSNNSMSDLDMETSNSDHKSVHLNDTAMNRYNQVMTVTPLEELEHQRQMQHEGLALEQRVQRQLQQQREREREQQQHREQQQQRERQQREQQYREQQYREQQYKEQQQREQLRREQLQREQQHREQQHREQQQREQSQQQQKQNIFAMLPPPPVLSSQLKTKTANFDFKEELIATEIVDFSPEEGRIKTSKQTKIILSCSETLNESSNGSCTWNTIAAFVNIKATVGQEFSELSMRAIDLSPVTRLNPYSYRCSIPEGAKLAGPRYIVLLSVHTPHGCNPVHEGLSSAVSATLAQAWSRAIRRKFSNSIPMLSNIVNSSGDLAKDASIRILTQFSKSSFLFLDNRSQTREGIKLEDDDDTKTSTGSSEKRALPAPPATMAMVATVLSDFPNPPARAVVPPDACVAPSAADMVESSDINQSKVTLAELADAPGAKAILSAALEATVDPQNDQNRKNRKRVASTIEAPPDNTYEGSEITTAAASAWANLPDRNHDGTKGEAVDRHCKIRFVEKLNTVISGTDNEGTNLNLKKTDPDHTSTKSGGSSESNSGILEDVELKAMDDEKLDFLLDGLLVRIVESLVEISASSYELQEELNAPDKSGFTLLHYAALYNLQSLIPVLLSRGANPDTPSLRGRLTPLHLACGSGHFAIVELLVRQGCGLEVADSFGSYPCDHAQRNGFIAIASYLRDKAGSEKDMRAENRVLENKRLEDMKEPDTIQNRTIDLKKTSSNINDNGKFLLQSAFSNLSLKDKLALNMVVKKRQLTSKKRPISRNHSNGEDITHITINEEEDESLSQEDESNKERNELPTEIHLRMHEEDADEDDEKNTARYSHKIDLFHEERHKSGRGKELNLSGKAKNRRRQTDIDAVSYISESDKESLDIAMKLMNDEELEDLENNSAAIDDDLEKWMLRRNYESLKEASLYLQDTLKKHLKNAGKTESSQNDQRSSTGNNSGESDQGKKHAKNAARRSLKNMQSQALAGLVLRKNMSHFQRK